MKFERHGGYYYCSMCEHFTRKSNALSMHISIKHHKETPHACKQCHLKFKTSSLLQQHVISKHTQSVIPCNHYGCTETFKTQTNQQIHFVRKHIGLENLMIRTLNHQWRCLTCSKIMDKNAMTYHVSLCSPKSPFCKKNAECFTPDLSRINKEYLAGITETAIDDKDIDKENATDIENVMPMNMMDACLTTEDTNVYDEELYQLLQTML